MMALSNRRIGRASFALLALAVLVLLAIPRLPVDLRPGSVVGQTLGIIAAVLMLGSVSYLVVRRSDSSERSKPLAQQLHALIGTVGVVVALVHSHAYLRHWSALVLLAALGLLVTGLYGRLVSPQRVGRAFGRGALPYSATSAEFPKLALGTVIKQKQKIAQILSHGKSSERLFVLRLQHWRRHPLSAWRYQRLARQERRLTARHRLCRDGAPLFPERWWRRTHLLLAVLIAVGIIMHVITVVFFAGYVADGREIYWWHLTNW